MFFFIYLRVDEYIDVTQHFDAHINLNPIQIEYT